LKEKILAVVIAILLLGLGAAVSWAVNLIILKLIAMCFDFTLTLKTATGIWLIIVLATSVIKGFSSK
jgi:hypothetical protein